MPRALAALAILMTLIGVDGADARNGRARFIVPREAFDRLAADLHLSGDTLDAAQALWGRQWFDLTHAEEAADLFIQWEMQHAPKAPELTVIPPEFRDRVRRWDLGGQQQYLRRAERVIFDAFYADLRSLVPGGGDAIDAHRRAMRRRAVLALRLGANQNTDGSTVDLIHALEILARQHPEQPLAPALWSPELKVIIDEYVRTLDALLIEFDCLYMEHNDPETRIRAPQRHEDRHAWVEKWVRTQSPPYLVAYRIRALNQRAAMSIAETLGNAAGDVFLAEARRLVSPFAWKRLEHEMWLDEALARDDLDSDLEEALVELQRRLAGEKARRAEHLVELYDATCSPVLIETKLRWDGESMMRLREPEEFVSDAETAFQQALATYAAFEDESTRHVLDLLGDRAGALAAQVHAAIEARDKEIQWAVHEPEARAEFERHLDTSFPRMNSPFMTAREFATCLEKIAFADDERRAIFQTLYDDFQGRFSAMRAVYDAEHRAALQKEVAGKVRDPADWRRAPRASGDFHVEWTERWTAKRRALERQFANDVRLFLTESELDIWNREVRRLRRERLVPYIRGHTSQEQRNTFDLIAALEDLELRTIVTPALADVLEACELDLDAACRDFEDRYYAVFGRLDALDAKLTVGNVDVIERRKKELVSELVRLAHGVARVCERYVPLIADGLDAEWRERFLEHVARQQEPWLYRASPPELVIDALRRDRALDGDPRTALDQLIDNYESALRELRRDYLNAIRRFDGLEDPASRQEMAADIYRLAARRVSLACDGCDAIRSLIPDEQFDDLALDIRLLLSSYN